MSASTKASIFLTSSQNSSEGGTPQLLVPCFTAELYLEHSGWPGAKKDTDCLEENDAKVMQTK